MKRSALHHALALLVVVFAAAAGCGGKGAETPEGEEGPNITSVSATVVVKDCPDASKGTTSKSANMTIRKLVSPCSKVPGGSVHFAATLLPGGRIELASPEGDATGGVVPTCVLDSQLKHNVPLRSPCVLDVKLDEQKVGAEEPAEGQEAK